jgi:hypothetical protein
MYENKHVLIELDKTRKELAELKSQFESFTETLDILTSDPHIFKDLAESKADYLAGRTFTLAEVEKELKISRKKKGK